MNTLPAHLLINAALEKKLGARYLLNRAAFLLGAVVPDVPLGVIAIGYFAYYRFFTGVNVSGIMDSAFGVLYFNDPVWIAGHNALHSPTALMLYALVLWRFRGQPGTPGHWGWSFVLGAMVHSVVDILTHYDDGPVVFFPFDWHTRFYSPVSYWDPAHYGNEFGYFELALNGVLFIYVVGPRLWRWLRGRRFQR